MAELTLQQATEIAEKHLTTLPANSQRNGLALVTRAIRETPYGWIFHYNTRKYLEDERKNFIYALAGNAPFLVEKNTGNIVQFGTAYPVDRYLAEYEQRRTHQS